MGFSIKTDHTVKTRRPDMIVEDNKISVISDFKIL